MLEKKPDLRSPQINHFKSIEFEGNAFCPPSNKISFPTPPKIMFAYRSTFRKHRYPKSESHNNSLQLESGNKSIDKLNSMTLELSRKVISDDLLTNRSINKRNLPTFSKPLAIVPLHVKNLEDEANLPIIQKNNFKRFSESIRLSKSGNQLRGRREPSPVNSYEFPSFITKIPKRLPPLGKEMSYGYSNENSLDISTSHRNNKLGFENNKQLNDSLLSKEESASKKKIPSIKLEKILNYSQDRNNSDDELLLDTITSKRKVENTRRVMDIRNVNISLQIEDSENSLDTKRVLGHSNKGFRMDKYFKPSTYRIISYRQLAQCKGSRTLIGNQEVRSQLKSIERILGTPVGYREDFNYFNDY